MNAAEQGSEMEKLWSVLADHQLLAPAVCIAVLAGVVWLVFRALRRGPRGS